MSCHNDAGGHLIIKEQRSVLIYVVCLDEFYTYLILHAFTEEIETISP